MDLRIVLPLGLVFTAVVTAAEPSVRTEGSVRILEDTNLYLQNPAPLAAGQARPALPWNESSTAIAAAASVGVAWKEAGGRVFEIGYAPEVFRYLGHSTENHTDHVLTLNAATVAAGWSNSVTTRYLYTDGSNEAPIFTGLGGTPAIGGEPVRARRTQAILRASGKATHSIGPGFVRIVGSIFDQQFHTVQRNLVGYCNYANRDETSAGVDFGYPMAPGVSLVAASRFGFQRQANLLGVPLNYSNTFTRWLAGVEKSAGRTLKFSLLAGPEIHRYGDSVRTGFVRNQRTGYAEAAMTWTPSRDDAIALTGRRYLWLSSAGRGLYADSVVDATWKRRLSPIWSTALGANFHDGDTSHFNRPAPRHDQILTETISLTRSFAHQTRIEFAVLHDEGNSLVPNTPARGYSRWIASTSVSRTW